MRFVIRYEFEEMFRGKSVALVGSAPSCKNNEPGFIDSHDVVVRVNNYRTGEGQGFRCDAHYSFYGTSVRKTVEELKGDGVTLCLCKCPEGKFMDSDWHRKMNKPHGVDFRYIYEARKDWWFCDTYVPINEEFVASFDLLDKHIPSTGFSALLLIKSLAPRNLYVTGFDFFSSGISSVDQPWRPGNPADPIGHAPDLERAWLAKNLDGITLDKKLTEILQ